MSGGASQRSRVRDLQNQSALQGATGVLGEIFGVEVYEEKYSSRLSSRLLYGRFDGKAFFDVFDADVERERDH